MKTWIALIVVLISGIIIGVIGTLFYVKSSIIKIAEGDYSRLTRMIVNRFESRLDLTDEQKEQIKNIIEKSRDELMELRKKIRPEVQDIISRAIKEIEPLLTDVQKKKFRRMLKRLIRGRPMHMRPIAHSLYPREKTLMASKIDRSGLKFMHAYPNIVFSRHASWIRFAF